MPKLYDLTKFTGSRKNDDRRMVIATIETDRRGAVLTGLGILASLPVVFILMIFIDGWALLSIFIIVPFAHFLGARRRDGLQISNLRAMDDRLGAKTGRSLMQSLSGSGSDAQGSGLQRKTGIIILAGRPLTKPRIVDLVPAVIPNPDYVDPDPDDPHAALTDIEYLIDPDAAPTEPESVSVPVHAIGKARPRAENTSPSRKRSELFLP